MRRSIICAFLALLSVATTAPVAGAAAQPVVGRLHSACPGGGFAWEAVGDQYSFTQASGDNSRVSGDPGTVLRIDTTTAYTATGTIGTTTGITYSDVVEAVKSDVNVTITKGYTRSVSNSGSWTVPSSYIHGGALAIGSRKHRGSVEKWQLNSACAEFRLLGSVNYNAPETGWYFKHFKLG